MTQHTKITKRGLVMTGGGAKGLYEAGVIHAFHLAGMNFEVITGSSIGAFNTIFLAEYLLQKKKLTPEILANPEAAVEAMDGMVKAYHHAWLKLPEVKIIDDSETGPFGKLKEDLIRFNLRLPDLVRLLWWWTDPDRDSLPPARTLRSAVRVAREFIERIGRLGGLLKVIKNHRDDPIQGAMRSYLRKFGIEKSLVPSEDDRKLSSVFTTPIEPLQAAHFQAGGSESASTTSEKIPLVPESRTLRDFAQAGIDVRLTRANYRTGRLEISAYFSAADFVRYLDKQAWRLRVNDPEKIPLGSFRLHLPGNPGAIQAALASGRFPGVLEPYPVEEIYPIGDHENAILHNLLKAWLQDPQVETDLIDAFQALHPDDESANQNWEETYAGWREDQRMRAFFPQSGDTYVDGGAIDNTPSNTAIDALREWVQTEGLPVRHVDLDLYTVFLHEEPVVEPAKIQDQALHQVVMRTLEIQGAAKQSSDGVVVDTINTFGTRAERLGDTLTVVLENYQEHLNSLGKKKRRAINQSLQQAAREAGLKGYLGENPEGIMDRMLLWADTMVQEKLPMQVNKIVIYPEEMPMSTLQFTERLGYRQSNALKMLTMGCYHTLETLLSHLVRDKAPKDQDDLVALGLTMKWMDLDNPPTNQAELDTCLKDWKCTRTACVFHEFVCPKGLERK